MMNGKCLWWRALKVKPATLDVGAGIQMSERVLIYIPDTDLVEIGMYAGGGLWFNEDDEQFTDEVSHWMEIPQAPGQAKPARQEAA